MSYLTNQILRGAETIRRNSSESNKNSAIAINKNMTADTPLRYMTVVYEITDENEWRKTNPLRYAHNGLSAVRVSIEDVCKLLYEAEAEVERLRKIVEAL